MIGIGLLFLLMSIAFFIVGIALELYNNNYNNVKTKFLEKKSRGIFDKYYQNEPFGYIDSRITTEKNIYPDWETNVDICLFGICGSACFAMAIHYFTC